MDYFSILLQFGTLGVGLLMLFFAFLNRKEKERDRRDQLIIGPLIFGTCLIVGALLVPGMLWAS